MKKSIFCLEMLSALLLICSLAGCSGPNPYLNVQIEKQSGVLDDSNYQKYQAYSEQSKLDQDGYYSQVTFDSEATNSQIPEGYAHVTFANNSYLNIHYYANEDQTNEFSSAGVNLAPGDHIYVSVSLNKNIPSSAYTFLGFRLSTYDVEGNADKEELLTPDENGLLLQIADNYVSKDMSLIPLGKYETQSISLRASYLDNDNHAHDLSGGWTLNDKSINGSTAEIAPVSSYVISYAFDSDEYFYLSSEPECYYSNSEDGIVIFNKRESTDNILDYSVKLHKYVSVSIMSAKARTVSINSGAKQQVAAGGELEISHLKYGDKVIIATDTEWKNLENCRDLILQSEEPCKTDKNNEYKYLYTLIVPQKGSEFAFDPSEYSYEHGTISFKCFGEEVTTIQYLAPDSKIVYEQASAEDGYWLAGGDHVITVSSNEATRKQLNAIHFIPKAQATVQLKQPQYGGQIEYYIDGIRIDDNTCRTTTGAEITMRFLPWEGWISNFNNGEKYVVANADSQSVTINGKDVDTAAFSEDPSHKPTLEIVLKKSVGESMQFSFEASGLDKDDYTYQDDWFRSDYQIVDPKKQTIGTERGITISMGNRAIQTGTAVKIQVDLTGEDKSGSKPQKVNRSYYRLIDNLTDLQAPISIYTPEEIGSSAIWYKSIKITVSVVDILKFIQPNIPVNTSVVLRNVETSEIIKPGDLLERSEKVTVTVSADKGYYVTGKNTKNDVYQNTMKFEKCVSDLQSIIDEHPVEKYCQLTLNPTDPYGTCVYKYDGSTVSGTINVHVGDKITLEYQVTDPNYVIEGASGILGTPLGKDTKKKTASITINRSYDGKTLTLDSFDIRVVKGV